MKIRFFSEKVGQKSHILMPHMGHYYSLSLAVQDTKVQENWVMGAVA